jgi:hypothetical protein
VIEDLRHWRADARIELRAVARRLGDSDDARTFAREVLCFCLQGVARGEKPTEADTWSFILALFGLNPTPPAQAAVRNLRELAARVDRAPNWDAVADDLLVTLSCQAAEFYQPGR